MTLGATDEERGASGAVRARERGGEPRGAGGDGSSPPRLLIVDNVVALGHALARLAAVRGWSAVVVRTWAEAQRRLAEDHFRLALVDYGLAGAVSGADAVAWVRAEHPEVATALMSGSEEAVPAGAAVGCQVLLKPFGVEQLAEVLDAVAPGPRTQSGR